MREIQPHGFARPGQLAIDPDSLFANGVLLHTRSPAQARSSVERVFFPHSLRTSYPGRVNFTHRGARLSSVSFNLIQYGADVEVATDEINRSHFVMVVPLAGEAEVKNHDQSSCLDRGRFVILDPRTGFRFHMPEDHNHLAIGIPKDLVWQHVNRVLPPRLAARVEFNHGSYVIDEGNAPLFNFIKYLCDELSSPRGVTRHPAVSAVMEETFLASLVTSLLDVQDLREDDHGGAVTPACLFRAERFIEANLAENISLADIVDAAGVPPRTLHHAFHRHRGMSPMAWLKLQRLRQARLDLLRAQETGATVTDVAMQYHMPHVGRFARAYELEFGELPSATLARSRA